MKTPYCETCAVKEFVFSYLYCKSCEELKKVIRFDSKEQTRFNQMSYDEFCSINFTEETFDLQAKIIFHLLRSDTTPEQMGSMIMEYEERARKDIDLYFKQKDKETNEK